MLRILFYCGIWEVLGNETIDWMARFIDRAIDWLFDCSMIVRHVFHRAIKQSKLQSWCKSPEVNVSIFIFWGVLFGLSGFSHSVSDYVYTQAITIYGQPLCVVFLICVTYWLIAWLIVLLIDWLIDWLVYCMIDASIFSLNNIFYLAICVRCLVVLACRIYSQLYYGS